MFVYSVYTRSLWQRFSEDWSVLMWVSLLASQALFAPAIRDLKKFWQAPMTRCIYGKRNILYICICMVRFIFVCSQCALTTWDHPSSLSRKPKLRRSSLCLTTFFWSQPLCVLRIHPATQAWQSNCFLNKIWKQNNIVPIFMDSTSPTILGPIAIHQELSHLVLVRSLVGF